MYRFIAKWKLSMYKVVIIVCSVFVVIAYGSAFTGDTTSELTAECANTLSSEGTILCSNDESQMVLDAPWAKAYGILEYAYGRAVQQTSDGGYIVAGYYDTIAYWGPALVMKTSATGTIQWRRTFAASGYDYGFASSIQQTSDGGYIVGGNATSYFDGTSVALVLKLNASGNILWRRVYSGGDKMELIKSIQQTSDGGYIAAGTTDSYGAGSVDILVMKLNSIGNILWRRTFGGTSSDYAYSIQQTSDGGYIVGGYTYSYGAGGYDVLVMKLNSTGNILWRRTFGGTVNDYAYSIQQTSDGGYIFAGNTYSYLDTTYGDILVVKLSAGGNMVWRRTFGGTSSDYAYSVQQTSDGGYIVGGYTHSFGAGSIDALVFKLDSAGNAQWRRTFGSTGSEYVYAIQQTSDGGYIATGSFYDDVLLLKFDANGNISGCSMTAPNLTIGAPDLSATATYLSVTAPALSVSAGSISVSAPDIATTIICP